MNTEEVIAAIKKLNFPLGDYIIMGGSSLAIREIRPTKDLDLLVSSRLYTELAQSLPEDPEYFRKWNRKRLKSDILEIYPDFYLEKENIFQNVSKIISNADIVNNLPIQPLAHLEHAKRDNSREKDLQDIVLMNEYSAVIYQGTIVEESLIDTTSLNQFLRREVRIAGENTANPWHVHYVQGTYESVQTLVHSIKPGWYAHFWQQNNLLVVFSGRLFLLHIDDKHTWQDAIAYGHSVGIPVEQLDFARNSAPLA